MTDPLILRISSRDWKHELGKCPSCGLRVGPEDVTNDDPRRGCSICPPKYGAVEEFHRAHFRVHPTHEADLEAKHRRCEATFLVIFAGATE